MGVSGFDQQVTFLLVEDLDRSSEFYGDVLGLDLALDQGDCRIFAVSDTAFLGVCERPGRTSGESVLVTLVTGDVDAWHESLVAAGTPCEQPPRRSEKYNVYHAFFRDPDGFLVEIQQFLDPGWPHPVG